VVDRGTGPHTEEPKYDQCDRRSVSQLCRRKFWRQGRVRRATFGDDASFGRVIFGDARFSGATFGAWASFDGAADVTAFFPAICAIRYMRCYGRRCRPRQPPLCGMNFVL
jgi:hypothetical protein